MSATWRVRVKPLSIGILFLASIRISEGSPKQQPVTRSADYDITMALLYPWTEIMPSAESITETNDIMQALERFQRRAMTFRTRITPPADPTNWVLQEMHVKYVAIERGAFCVIGGGHGMDAAHEFATSLALSYETEGLPDIFLAEADSAERFLQTHPRSPLRAYAALFAASRNICAASAMAFFHRPVGERRPLSRAAKQQLQRARQTTQPLIWIAAEYLLANSTCLPFNEK